MHANCSYESGTSFHEGLASKRVLLQATNEWIKGYHGEKDRLSWLGEWQHLLYAMSKGTPIWLVPGVPATTNSFATGSRWTSWASPCSCVETNRGFSQFSLAPTTPPSIRTLPGRSHTSQRTIATLAYTAIPVKSSVCHFSSIRRLSHVVASYPIL
jgi:hypothetical protein